MPHIELGDERNFVKFIDVATRFPAAMPTVSSAKIIDLIDALFNNFMENYGRTPKILSSINAAEYLSQRVRHTLQTDNCNHVPTSTYSPEENDPHGLIICCSVLGAAFHKSTQTHLQLLHRVIRNIKGTHELGLHFLAGTNNDTELDYLALHYHFRALKKF